jgi:hypothetical protein
MTGYRVRDSFADMKEPVMGVIAELGSFLTREQAAAGQPAPLAAVSPPPAAAAANGAAVSGAAEPS